MLLQLTIQNFAIVKSLDIEWQKGMTTITGETGAGKSIAIDALGLCLGDRATTNVVRPGAKKTDLVATFCTRNNVLAEKWLNEKELNDDNECLLRRVISAEGRSKAYINGSQVPLAQLKEIGQLLLNIHGQHDHQLIVKATEQRRMLDDYANHNDLINDVKHYYKEVSQLTHQLNTLQENQAQREAKRQLLQYQVKELDEFALADGEYETLENDFKKQNHAQHILTETAQSLDLLSENEQLNVISVLQRNVESFTELAEFDASLAPISQMLNEALIQVEEASSDIRHYHDRLELDPEAFAIIEERYTQALQLAKKHHVAPEKLSELHAELSAELASISGDETRIEGLSEEIEAAKQSYLQAANVLSASRTKSAQALSKLITGSMQELNMPHGQFDITVSPSTDEQVLSTSGIDTIGFNVSLNPGQPLEPMHKVASGGELSRISLAMQVILAGKIVSPTLIFDEVDVGISGPTAAMVGEKLQQLAQNTQVICVTHLPQVASKGHQQLFVAKLTDGEHTETTVTELSAQGRVKEIARLLAGNKVTESSLANAQELLAS